MLSVYLEAMEFEVPKSIFCKYHDEGYVLDVKKHFEQLDKIYDVFRFSFPFFPSMDEQEEKNGRVRAGSVGVYFKKKIKHVHVAYLKNKGPIMDLWVRIHEEAHAIEKIGKRAHKKLKQKMMSDCGIDISLLEEELRENVIAIHWLMKKGFSVEDLVKRDGGVPYVDENRSLQKAYDLIMDTKN